MSRIHPTAIVDPAAQLAADVEIGAFSIIGPNVKMGPGCRVASHVVIEGHTTIGEGNRFYQFSSIGANPQDKKYKDEPTELVIGNFNTVREFCTFNTGTVQDGGITRMGDHNWVMAYVHVAHDCMVGNHTILANNATLAGHVHVGDWVILGGFTSVHQFSVIGDHAMTGFASAVAQDVPPFVMAQGNRATPAGINSEGLRRRGFSPEAISAIKRAYKALYRQGLSYEAARQQIAEAAETQAELQVFNRFFEMSTRGIIR